MNFSESPSIPIFARIILSPAMSTTSTMTALAAHNHVPGNQVELSCMCVLVLTRSNRTLFNATSIQEEDIVELCIELGQRHPKGVLQYLVTESVILFCSVDEMLVKACGVIKAMVLCEKPIWLHMSPPSTTHVRAYVVVRDGEPSGTQPPIPDGEEVPQPSPINPHLDGRTPHQFQVELGDLGDAKLRQLMEDLQHDVALRDLNVPPRDPLLHCWATGGVQQALGILMWMTRRSLLQEGGDGNQEDNHLDPLPPQPEEDVGCLINMLATRLSLGTPCINTFSGEAMLQKWKCLLSNGTMRYNALMTTPAYGL